MCRVHHHWTLFVAAFLLLALLVGIPAFQWKNDSGRSLELDTSRLTEDGTVGVRISPDLSNWSYETAGRIEITRQGGKTVRETVQPGEWCYIALKNGNGKYTFTLWSAGQSNQDTPVATQHLEVMSLKPM